MTSDEAKELLDSGVLLHLHQFQSLKLPTVHRLLRCSAPNIYESLGVTRGWEEFDFNNRSIHCWKVVPYPSVTEFMLEYGDQL